MSKKDHALSCAVGGAAAVSGIGAITASLAVTLTGAVCQCPEAA